MKGLPKIVLIVPDLGAMGDSSEGVWKVIEDASPYREVLAVFRISR